MKEKKFKREEVLDVLRTLTTSAGLMDARRLGGRGSWRYRPLAPPGRIGGARK